MSASAQLAIALQGASAQAADGDLSTAIELVDQALDAATMVLGQAHPDVVQASRELADLHRRAGELPQARRLLEQAQTAGSQRLGERHPAMLAVAHDLARLAAELGNLHEARRNYDQVATHGPAALGAGHEYVQAAQRYLERADTGPPMLPPSPIAVPGLQLYAQHRPDPWAAQPASDTPNSAADLFEQRIYRPQPRPQAPLSPADQPPPAILPLAANQQPPPSQQSAVNQPSPASHQPPARRHFPASQQPPVIQLPGMSRALPPGDDVTFAAGEGSRREGRAGALILVLIAAVVLLGGLVVGAVALGRRQHDGGGGTATSGAPATKPPASATAPDDGTAAAGAPTGLELQDNSTSITLTWKDPADGKVPFLVAGGQGTDIRTLQVTRDSRFTLSGLNPKLDYCFTVAAVYGTDRVAASGLACTSRAPATTSGTPAPTGSARTPG